MSSRGLDAISPRGELAAPPSSFRWLWEGEDQDFAVVLLDEEQAPLLRLVTRGKELSPCLPLDLALARGSRFHWYVETETAEGVLRSAPAAFAISR